MSALEIHCSWEPAERITAPELAATFCRLRISVDGVPVTACMRTGSGLADAVCVSAYPLAEWLALHWHGVLHAPARDGVGMRLSEAAEGWALPDLAFRATGADVELLWRASAVPASGVRFLSGGGARVPTGQLATALGRFVETVVGRLAETGISDSALQREWAALKALSPAEAAFARACGRLGVDPFAEDPRLELLPSLVEALPESEADEVLSAADISELGALRKRVHAWNERLQGGAVVGVDIRALRREAVAAEESESTPWKRGYALAREVRHRLRLGGGGVPSARASAWVNAGVWSRVGRAHALEALVDLNRPETLRFVAAGRSPQARAFLACRALHAALVAPRGARAVVTSSCLPRQQAGRAFAAELLAPAEVVRREVDAARGAGVEDIPAVVARRLGVAVPVVLHQAENHGFGSVLGDWGGKP